MAPSRLVLLLCLAALTAPAACSLGSYDYLSSEFAAAGEAGGEASGGAAGAPALPGLSDCEGKEDGTVCDDDDVCTLTSLCSSGICRGSGDHPCVVADSIRDFSTTQGLLGFWYGAWAAGSDPDGEYDPDQDFAPLQVCPPETYRPNCLNEGEPGFRWTQLSRELAHAATEPELELPVRRWVSTVSGPASALVDHHHADPGAGDGTRASLLIDGQLVWEHEIAGDDSVGVKESIPIRLSAGARVELLLHPRANQAQDMTHLSLTISGK